jgi:hypothetical protein
MAPRSAGRGIAVCAGVGVGVGVAVGEGVVATALAIGAPEPAAVNDRPGVGDAAADPRSMPPATSPPVASTATTARVKMAAILPDGNRDRSAESPAGAPRFVGC